MSTSTTPQATGESQNAGTFEAKAYAAQSATSALAPYQIPRREPRPQDVQIRNPVLRRVSLGLASGKE